jgi:hypothetical protein
MLLNDRVLVELQNMRRFAFTEFSQQIAKKTKLTDQDGVFDALVLIPQLTDVEIRIIRRAEHIPIPPLLLLALGQGVALKVRGRRVGFLQQRWA